MGQKVMSLMTKPEEGFFRLVAPHRSHMDVSWWYICPAPARQVVPPGPALPIDFPVRNCTLPKYGVMTARFQHPVRDHGGRHLVMYSRRHHLQTESGGQTAM